VKSSVSIQEGGPAWGGGGVGGGGVGGGGVGGGGVGGGGGRGGGGDRVYCIKRTWGLLEKNLPQKKLRSLCLGKKKKNPGDFVLDPCRHKRRDRKSEEKRGRAIASSMREEGGGGGDVKSVLGKKSLPTSAIYNYEKNRGSRIAKQRHGEGRIRRRLMA